MLEIIFVPDAASSSATAYVTALTTSKAQRPWRASCSSPPLPSPSPSPSSPPSLPRSQTEVYSRQHRRAATPLDSSRSMSPAQKTPFAATYTCWVKDAIVVESVIFSASVRGRRRALVERFLDPKRSLSPPAPPDATSLGSSQKTTPAPVTLSGAMSIPQVRYDTSWNTVAVVRLLGYLCAFALTIYSIYSANYAVQDVTYNQRLHLAGYILWSKASPPLPPARAHQGSSSTTNTAAFNVTTALHPIKVEYLLSRDGA